MPSPSRIRSTEKYLVKLQAVNKDLPIMDQTLRYKERMYEVRANERYFGIVEGNTEYQYTANMAAKLAVWAKERKANGLTMKFKDFYDQLGYIEQGNIRVLKYDRPPNFLYQIQREKVGVTKRSL